MSPTLESPPPAPRRFGRLASALRSLPWADLGVVAAVVTIGGSQILFTLILENLDYFPRQVWFHLAVLFWTAALPFALLLALDLGIARLTRRGRIFGVWRALLCTFLFASLLRQAQIYYPAPFNWVLLNLLSSLLVASLLAIVFALCFRFQAPVGRFVGALGLLAALLAGSYVQRSGLLGPLWDASWTSAKAARTPWKGDPIFVLVFDELGSDVLMKDGRIDAELFPNFAALAAEAAWFPRATTNHVYTQNAIPCMLTGRISPPNGAPKLFDYLPPDCRVVARGYFAPTYDWMHSHSRPGQVFLLRGLLEEPLKDFLQVPLALRDLLSQTPYSRSPFELPGPAARILPPLLRPATPDLVVESEIEGFLAAVNAREAERTLTFWHAPLPHFPFLFDADGTQHRDVSTEFLRTDQVKGRGLPAGYSPDKVFANYRRQVQFTDRVLGRFLARLREEGIDDRSTVIVTSDHGLRSWGILEGLDYPREMHGRVGRIPLFIRSPGLPAGPRAAEYQHVDFTPTVLDVLGIPWEEKDVEGISAFAKDRPSRTPRILDHARQTYTYDAEKDLWRAPRSP